MRRLAVVVLAMLAACGTSPVGDSTTVTSTTLLATTSTSTTAVPTTSTSLAPTTTTGAVVPLPTVEGLVEYPVPAGTHPHDVAVTPDGAVWYTGQETGVLGRIDPAMGDLEEVDLGPGSAPHGVIVGPDRALWVTDGGLNAIVRVDPSSRRVRTFLLDGGDANLNTAVFDLDGILWFTGQAGIYGRLDPATAEMEIFEAGGAGPYGITVTPSNEVFYASLAGNHIAQIDVATGMATRIDPPTADQGARRVWSDSSGVVWVSEWNAGQLGAYDPSNQTWQEWPLPSGAVARAYAVYVDETDRVWLTDFGGNGSLVRFDPFTETFESFPLPTPNGDVRQLNGIEGQVWGAESAANALIVARFG
ncbi:MAG TPA: lyase [Acidimicrobiia bacterium]|jgi:virginiamycin B lyase